SRLSAHNRSLPQCGNFQLPRLLDDLVSARQQGRGNFDIENLGRLQIDDELESSRQLNRHLGCFLAFENAAGVDSYLPKLLRKVRSVAHQPASFHKLPSMIQRWKRVARS